MTNIYRASPAMQMMTAALGEFHLSPDGPKASVPAHVPATIPEGYTEREGIIWPDDVPWFSSADFWGYLWGFEDSVWLSTVVSIKPGTGKFSGLWRAIEATGRKVVGVNPNPRALAIHKAKGGVRVVEPTLGCELWIHA